MKIKKKKKKRKQKSRVVPLREISGDRETEIRGDDAGCFSGRDIEPSVFLRREESMLTHVVATKKPIIG